MFERIQQIKHKLAASRQRLNDALDQVGDRWQTQVYSDGAAWTVHQLAIHLMITDNGQTNTVKAVVNGEELVPADFDLERYNRRSVEKRADTTIDEIRSSLAQTAAERDAWLETLDDEALAKTGRHGSLRILTVAEFLDVIADHERTHADDIARVLNID
jgi:hypothetical protein